MELKYIPFQSKPAAATHRNQSNYTSKKFFLKKQTKKHGRLKLNTFQTIKPWKKFNKISQARKILIEYTEKEIQDDQSFRQQNDYEDDDEYTEEDDETEYSEEEVEEDDDEYTEEDDDTEDSEQHVRGDSWEQWGTWGGAEQTSLVKKVAIGILLIIVVVIGFQKVQQVNRDKATSKGYALALSALDKLQLRCSVLWSEIGVDKVCSQRLAEMAIGKLKKDVELKVIEGRSQKFTAQAKAKGAGGDKTFQINKKGKLFLNVNGCLAEIRVLNPTVEEIKRLEKQC